MTRVPAQPCEGQRKQAHTQTRTHTCTRTDTQGSTRNSHFLPLWSLPKLVLSGYSPQGGGWGTEAQRHTGCTRVSVRHCTHDRHVAPALAQGLISISTGRLATAPFQAERRCRQRRRSQAMEAGPRRPYRLSSLCVSWLPCHPGCPSKVLEPPGLQDPPPSKGPARSGSLRSPHPAAPNPLLWAGPEPSPAPGRQHLQSGAYSSPQKAERPHPVLPAAPSCPLAALGLLTWAECHPLSQKPWASSDGWKA